MKRTRTRSPPQTNTLRQYYGQPKRQVYKIPRIDRFSTLPLELLEVIFKFRLGIVDDEHVIHNPYQWAAEHRFTCKRFYDAFMNVIRSTWRQSYLDFKSLCATHDWRNRCIQLDEKLTVLEENILSLSHIGFREEIQFSSRLHPGLYHLCPDELVHNIVRIYAKPLSLVPRLLSHARPCDRTFALVFWDSANSIDWNDMCTVLDVLIPVWIQADIDECISVMWTWCDMYSWTSSTTAVKDAIGFVILKHKLNVQNISSISDSRSLVRNYDLLWAWQWDHKIRQGIIWEKLLADL